MPYEGAKNTILCGAGLDKFSKIYCKCGRIADVDFYELRLKKSLNKAVECPYCRNKRISEELDKLDDHYDVIEEVPDF